MRSLAVLSLAALTFAGCNLPRHRAERIVTQQLETSPLSTLSLQTFNGKISIKTHQKPTVEMTVTYATYGESPEEAAALCEQMDTDVSADDGKLTLVANKPKGLWNASANFELLIPSQCDVVLKTSNGDVDIRGLQGDVEISTSNGALRIENVAGDILARTSNGKISTRGNVGQLDLKTSNGRVEVEGMLVGMENRIRTSNGKITVQLPPEATAEIEASTSNGKIHCDLPMHEVFSQKKRSLHALVGQAGSTPESKLTLSSSNGSITISAADPVMDAEVDSDSEPFIELTSPDA